MTQVWAIRCHGRRWLGLTRSWAHPQVGWRPFSWVRDVADAEKFGSRLSAEIFLRGLARGCGEVVPLHPDCEAGA